MLLARFQDETGGHNGNMVQPAVYVRQAQKEQRYKLRRIEIKDKRRYIINPIFEPEDGTAMTGNMPGVQQPQGSGVAQGLYARAS